MNTAFKPKLENYGQRKKYFVPLWTLFALICLITPFTNWMIPIAKAKVKGKVYFVRER